MKQGTLFVISAPSGAGKTTVLQQVLQGLSGISFSISHTTRRPRSGEQDGKDYHFTDSATFKKMIEQQEFLEWAEVHGNFYGTSKAAIASYLDSGSDIILDIDVQGAAQVRQAADVASVSVFILPPSLAELEKRLRGRGTDADDIIATRLINARQEIEAAELYDHIIINDSIDTAVQMVRSVILADRSRNRRDHNGKPLSLPQ